MNINIKLKIAVPKFSLTNKEKIKSLDGEIWKETEYDGYYASNKGRIKSVKARNHKEIILSEWTKSNGYKCVTIRDNDGNKCNKHVHRLVASAFIPNPHNYPQVNHIDENKANNTPENLEWCSADMNIKAHFNRRVKQIDKDGNVVAIYTNARTAAKILGKLCSYNSIIACLNHEKNYKTAFGYRWEYE